MGKVFIFGMGGVIVIGLIMLMIFGGSLAAKLASLFWKGKKDEEERDDKRDEGPHGPVGRGPGSGWV